MVKKNFFLLLSLSILFDFQVWAKEEIHLMDKEEIKARLEERPGTEEQPITKKDFDWIGEVEGEVLWAKYFNAAKHFNWNGQLGVNIDILRYKKAFLYVKANLETVLEEDVGTDFDPYDMNYMIEPGVRLENKIGSLSFIWHHVCQHDVDRFDGTTEKYNIGGIRLESKRKDSFENKENFEWLWNFSELFSVGKYVQRTDNNYDWDVIGEAGVDILRYKKMAPYLKANTHLVTQTADRPSGKKYFLNYTIEPGIKLRIPKGTLSLFCQIWHKHDIDRCDGKTDDFGLAGIRYEW
jgi:hypothetical protein